MIRISITGPENSGKSDLAKALAEHFQTAYAKEFAREYLAEPDGRYGFEDLTEICKGQIRAEEIAEAEATDICFFDTDMLVLFVWAKYRFGKIPEIISEQYRNRHYDHYLLCSPDLPWSPDPFRESPSREEREQLFSIYKKELEGKKASFSVVEGKGDVRVGSALKALMEKGFLDKNF